jgi:ubiquinone/menaquinone biosynthesis C-methylase UbiE
MSEWFERSFGEDYLLVYKHRDMQGAKQEVHKMISWLNLHKGATVLDLCCGMGRHSLALAEAGYEVTGVDLSKVLLREAQKNDTEKQIKFIKADMRNLPITKQFDAIVNLFSSFGYFETDEEHLQVLQEIKRLLIPGGKFIIDFLNPAYTMANLVSESQRVDEGQLIQEKRSIEQGYVKKQITITDINYEGLHVKQPERHYLERIRLYSSEDFKSLLSKVDLTLENIYGGYNGEPYNVDSSKRMIMVGSN